MALSLCLVACIVILGVAALTLVSSFSRTTPIEMALSLDRLTQTVDKEVIATSGFHFIGPFSTLMRYPKTLQTVEYDQRHRDLLDGRTSDGLPLVLGISFQYRLDPTRLYDLYRTFGPDHKVVFQRVGVHLVTEIATRFTAYQFFNEKQNIATQMQQALDSYFFKHLYASVETLQINEDDLPTEFLDAILLAATTKQNVTRTQKLLDSERVNMQTLLIVAHNKANQTISHARGEQSKIMQESKAAAAITKAYVEAETTGYSIIKQQIGLAGDPLLDYIYYDILSGGGVNGGGTFASQVLVGLHPSTYISN